MAGPWHNQGWLNLGARKALQPICWKVAVVGDNDAATFIEIRVVCPRAVCGIEAQIDIRTTGAEKPYVFCCEPASGNDRRWNAVALGPLVTHRYCHCSPWVEPGIRRGMQQRVEVEISDGSN